MIFHDTPCRLTNSVNSIRRLASKFIFMEIDKVDKILEVYHNPRKINWAVCTALSERTLVEKLI